MKNTIMNKKGFTIIELMIVITILGILMMVWFNSFDGQGAYDKVRTKTLKNVQVKVEEFKSQYGVYPNSSSTGRRYPTGCSVTGYESLMDCFVTLEWIVADTETYEETAYDPTEGERNSENNEYDLYYGSANNGQKYKLSALSGKQETDLMWLDGNEAQKWSRYISVVSENTALWDVTNMNK